METLPAPETAGTARCRETADDLRRVLRDLGADDDLVSRVVAWADLGGHGYVYVPPLPADIVSHLVRLLPGPAVR
ncbi:hypothetical protein NMG29_06745 [Streptomyces cocklensis]|uniref:hypothetical protein n=1 Tax=Actinacidiphila cocklensis TaxID=887465 RepID=UPI00203FF13D|nr:hypothetical protein [Actinacidiphila cocklensis]MDD1057930.1 hypothetical protein [Actinacidiphila cocklensis]